MKTETKTAIIFGAIIVGVIGGLSFAFTTLESETSPTEGTKTTQQANELKTTGIDKSGFKKAPNLIGIEHYINTTPEKLSEQIEDKVVLYDIWTYSCINCIRTLPYITAWHDRYADDGLLIIGIHSPEFEFEKDTDNVEMAVDKYGIQYPVVLDNEKKTWDAFENRYWPRKYIADHEGYIRYDHIGEGAYKQTEKVIQQLLEERAQQLGVEIAAAEPTVDIEEFEHSTFRTSELYFGYYFAQGRNQLGNQEGFSPENIVTYSIPENLRQHYFYLEGSWENLKGSMKLVSDKGVIKLPYHAKQVNIVAGNPAEINVLLDGKPIPTEYAGKNVVDAKIMIDEPNLYNIISSNEASSHLLELEITNPGFEIYTFTFG